MLQSRNDSNNTSMSHINESFSQLIAKNISLQGQNTKIVLVLGPCRTGTTAFLRVFSEVGVESWYQPIKQIIRGRIYNNKNYSLQISDAPYVMIKETMGGMTDEEVWYNPIEILMEAGVANENIHLLSITREPISVACSLIRNLDAFPLEAKANVSNMVERFARGYESTIRLIAYAKKHVIEHTPFVYEMLRDHDPEVIRRLLLDRVGIAYTEDKMNWSDLPPIETSTKFSKFTNQAEHYTSPNLHANLNRSNGLTYYAKSVDELTNYMTDSELSAVRRSGAFDFYHIHREMCYAFFGLSINKTFAR